ncbi:MAG: NADH-quinone oxidoreductase subunit H, partial [Alkalinema sp. CAN_BIN05]|nr:NADH-quinone oxidoreductase subunit H [Alkalinema sp. CAN_BIN05]
LNLNEMVGWQKNFDIWVIVLQPLAFVIYFIAVSAELNRTPTDIAEAESEIVAGYLTEYSGMKFALFYLGSYVNLTLSALLVSILYLGGWEAPIPVGLISSTFNISDTTPWLQVVTGAIGIVMTLVKTYALVFFIVLIRWTIPRVRIDQLLNLGWKFLLPVSLANLLATAGLKLTFPAFFGG